MSRRVLRGAVLAQAEDMNVHRRAVEPLAQPVNERLTAVPLTQLGDNLRDADRREMIGQAWRAWRDVPMSLVLVCPSITAARRSQPQQAGDPGDLYIGRMTDVAAGDP